MPEITILDTPADTTANNWFYSAIIDAGEYGATRDELMLRLIDHGIHVRPVWRLNHKQPPYAGELSYGVERAEWFGARVLNLPVHAHAHH